MDWARCCRRIEANHSLAGVDGRRRAPTVAEASASRRPRGGRVDVRLPPRHADRVNDLTALPDWLYDASDQAVAWHLRALLALVDAAARVGWRGDMRHLPSVGLSGPGPYLVVKQDDNGATFVTCETQLPWEDELVATRTQTPPRSIGSWTHPTAHDIAEASAGTTTCSQSEPDQRGRPSF